MARPSPHHTKLALAIAAAVGVAALGPMPGPAHAAPAIVTASFTFSPARPLVNQPVRFTSTSTVTGAGTVIVSQSWDLDGDGQFDDATGPTAGRSYGAGPKTIGLQVVDSKGKASTVVHQVIVNRPPIPSIALAPSSPVAGQAVSFFSTSTDPDGYVRAYGWDLDNDGSFDDGAQSLASRSFLAPGSYAVRLRVIDDAGAAAVATVVAAVGAPGSPLVVVQRSPGGGQTAAGVLLSPFPIVRVSGIVTGPGVRLRLVSINAPPGSLVTVRCRGRGCPFRKHSLTVKPRSSGTQGGRSGSRLVKIRRFDRRVLRSGAVVQVFVSREDAVGKYTRLRVRRGHPPARVDRCLPPGRRTPIRCPST